MLAFNLKLSIFLDTADRSNACMAFPLSNLQNFLELSYRIYSSANLICNPDYCNLMYNNIIKV